MKFFEDYLDEVIADFMIGGKPWGRAYMDTLRKMRPTLAQVIATRPHLNPAEDESYLAGFIYYVRSSWTKHPEPKEQAHPQEFKVVHGQVESVNQPKPKGPTEGWGAIRPGDRKGHYYREQTALCRKVGFYFGPLEPEDDKPSRDDCAACRKLLDKEKAQSVTA